MTVDKCTDVHCSNDTDRAGGVTIYERNFDGNVENIVNRDFGEMDDVCNENIVNRDFGGIDDVCNDVNVENGVNINAGAMGDVGKTFDAEKVKWTVGKGNEVNAEDYVNRSGGSAVAVCMYDVCSEVFIQ